MQEIDGFPVWLRHQAFDRRVVFLNGPLTAETAMRVSAELMTLDATSSDPIDLYLDSSGGPLEPAFHLIDTLDLLTAEPRVHVRGEAAGTAVAVVAVARHRTATPNAVFRFEEPAVRVVGFATPDVTARVEHHQRLMMKLQERLAQVVGRTVEQIASDLRSKLTLTAPQALEYELIDAIEQAAVRVPKV